MSDYTIEQPAGRVVWMRRDDDGDVIECDDDEVIGYAIDYYPGPGEQHADQHGIWYETV